MRSLRNVDTKSSIEQERNDDDIRSKIFAGKSCHCPPSNLIGGQITEPRDKKKVKRLTKYDCKTVDITPFFIYLLTLHLSQNQHQSDLNTTQKNCCQTSTLLLKKIIDKLATVGHSPCGKCDNKGCRKETTTCCGCEAKNKKQSKYEKCFQDFDQKYGDFHNQVSQFLRSVGMNDIDKPQNQEDDISQSKEKNKTTGQQTQEQVNPHCVCGGNIFNFKDFSPDILVGTRNPNINCNDNKQQVHCNEQSNSKHVMPKVCSQPKAVKKKCSEAIKKTRSCSNDDEPEASLNYAYSSDQPPGVTQQNTYRQDGRLGKVCSSKSQGEVKMKNRFCQCSSNDQLKKIIDTIIKECANEGILKEKLMKCLNVGLEKLDVPMEPCILPKTTEENNPCPNNSDKKYLCAESVEALVQRELDKLINSNSTLGEKTRTSYSKQNDLPNESRSPGNRNSIPDNSDGQTPCKYINDHPPLIFQKCLKCDCQRYQNTRACDDKPSIPKVSSDVYYFLNQDSMPMIQNEKLEEKLLKSSTNKSCSITNRSIELQNAFLQPTNCKFKDPTAAKNIQLGASNSCPPIGYNGFLNTSGACNNFNKPSTVRSTLDNWPPQQMYRKATQQCNGNIGTNKPHQLLEQQEFQQQTNQFWNCDIMKSDLEPEIPSKEQWQGNVNSVKCRFDFEEKPYLARENLNQDTTPIDSSYVYKHCDELNEHNLQASETNYSSQKICHQSSNYVKNKQEDLVTNNNKPQFLSMFSAQPAQKECEEEVKGNQHLRTEINTVQSGIPVKIGVRHQKIFHDENCYQKPEARKKTNFEEPLKTCNEEPSSHSKYFGICKERFEERSELRQQKRELPLSKINGPSECLPCGSRSKRKFPGKQEPFKLCAKKSQVAHNPRENMNQIVERPMYYSVHNKSLQATFPPKWKSVDDVIARKKIASDSECSVEDENHPWPRPPSSCQPVSSYINHSKNKIQSLGAPYRYNYKSEEDISPDQRAASITDIADKFAHPRRGRRPCVDSEYSRKGEFIDPRVKPPTKIRDKRVNPVIIELSNKHLQETETTDPFGPSIPVIKEEEMLFPRTLSTIPEVDTENSSGPIQTGELSRYFKLFCLSLTLSY